jgi:hypothetical protein
VDPLVAQLVDRDGEAPVFGESRRYGGVHGVDGPAASGKPDRAGSPDQLAMPHAGWQRTCGAAPAGDRVGSVPTRERAKS